MHTYILYTIYTHITYACRNGLPNICEKACLNTLSLEVSFELRQEWADLADWQAASSRQTER